MYMFINCSITISFALWTTFRGKENKNFRKKEHVGAFLVKNSVHLRFGFFNWMTRSVCGISGQWSTKRTHQDFSNLRSTGPLIDQTSYRGIRLSVQTKEVRGDAP